MILETNEIREIYFDGSKLAAIRRKKGLSQRQLARAVGITNQSVNGMELKKYKPSADTLSRLCFVLDIPIKDVCQIPEKFFS